MSAAHCPMANGIRTRSNIVGGGGGSIPFIMFALPFSLLPSCKSDPASQGRRFSPPPPLQSVPCTLIVRSSALSFPPVDSFASIYFGCCTTVVYMSTAQYNNCTYSPSNRASWINLTLIVLLYHTRYSFFFCNVELLQQVVSRESQEIDVYSSVFYHNRHTLR